MIILQPTEPKSTNTENISSFDGDWATQNGVVYLSNSATLNVGSETLQLPQMGGMNRNVPIPNGGNQTIEGFKVWSTGLVTTYKKQQETNDERKSQTYNNILKLLAIHKALPIDYAGKRVGKTTNTDGKVTGDFWAYDAIIVDGDNSYPCQIILEFKVNQLGREEKTIKLCKRREYASTEYREYAPIEDFDGNQDELLSEINKLGINTAVAF